MNGAVIFLMSMVFGYCCVGCGMRTGWVKSSVAMVLEVLITCLTFEASVRVTLLWCLLI